MCVLDFCRDWPVHNLQAQGFQYAHDCTAELWLFFVPNTTSRGALPVAVTFAARWFTPLVDSTSLFIRGVLNPEAFPPAIHFAFFGAGR